MNPLHELWTGYVRTHTHGVMTVWTGDWKWQSRTAPRLPRRARRLAREHFGLTNSLMVRHDSCHRDIKRFYANLTHA